MVVRCHWPRSSGSELWIELVFADSLLFMGVPEFSRADSQAARLGQHTSILGLVTLAAPATVLNLSLNSNPGASVTNCYSGYSAGPPMSIGGEIVDFSIAALVTCRRLPSHSCRDTWITVMGEDC